MSKTTSTTKPTSTWVERTVPCMPTHSGHETTISGGGRTVSREGRTPQESQQRASNDWRNKK